MECRAALAAGLVLAGLAGGMGGCAVVDQYSGRAVAYNLEAEQAQEQALLLNVVRAYLRRPMQFTSLTNITGIATATGNAGLTVPLGPHSGSMPWSGMFGGSVAGGPTFVVPVLDLQDFYNGILNPIPGQIVDLYIQQGYPRDLLFNVFIQKIVMKRTGPDCRVEFHGPKCELTFRNYVGTDLDLDLFQSLMGYLIRLGLTTEPFELAKKTPKDGAKKEGAKKEGEKTEKEGKQEDKDDKPSLSRSYTFCFAPGEPALYTYLKRNLLCGNPGSVVKLKSSEVGRSSLVEGVLMDADFIHYLYAKIIHPQLNNPVSGAEGFADIGVFAEKQVSLAFYARSTEGIIYYLGEVARRQLRPELDHAPRVVQYKSGPPTLPFPPKPCSPNPDDPVPNGYSCSPLFVLEESGGPAALSVYYGGSRYLIPSGHSGGASMSVLALLKQLFAVNISAKQLPASNVLTVVGTP